MIKKISKSIKKEKSKSSFYDNKVVLKPWGMNTLYIETKTTYL